MAGFDDFFGNILPGNYFLTKSMELTKARESGTLWYTKKFLVFYYYIFLTNKIETTEYQREIVDIFDNYIASLSGDVRDRAREFFYPQGERGCSNLKGGGFRYFSDFCGISRFDNDNEKKAFYEAAKKYYFAFLMGSGGQSGVKAEIKRNLYKPDFDMTKLDEVIISYDNTVTNLSGIKNDYHAFLRNERQVLYFLGYFHSKTSGAKDREFSSLTPVGELALKANFDEFLALWEHQKIKMVSQPPTIEIEGVFVEAPERFAISFSPYYDILTWLLTNSDIKKDEYKYILSRKSSRFSGNEWQDIAAVACEEDNYDKLVAHINALGRTRDIKTEDFNKELSKYLLGLRDDLQNDGGTNYYGVCKDTAKAGKYELTEREKLQNILTIYTAIEEYKKQKYEALHKKCEKEIRRQYIAKVQGNDYRIDKKRKIDWDMYNITPDKLVVFGVIVSQTCAIDGILPTREGVIGSIDTMLGRFSGLLAGVGLASKPKLRNEIKLFFNAVENYDFSEYLLEDDDYFCSAADSYYEVSSEGLFAKIEEASDKHTDYSYDRKRNASLVSLMKMYYVSCFAKNDKAALRCEACNDNAFLTQNGEAYLEFHHLIPFKICNGPDHFLNLYGLCANCHRKIHFGSSEIKNNLYASINENSYLQQTIFARLKHLREANILKSYHLEYLYASGAITEDEYEKIAE
ncbi:MAG: HNH endonuclease [Defluviitaleaceae bacterium]|nr:HNH endonuclease [Defluviitaleaceae bacterium]